MGSHQHYLLVYCTSIYTHKAHLVSAGCLLSFQLLISSPRPIQVRPTMLLLIPQSYVKVPTWKKGLKAKWGCMCMCVSDMAALARFHTAAANRIQTLLKDGANGIWNLCCWIAFAKINLCLPHIGAVQKSKFRVFFLMAFGCCASLHGFPSGPDMGKIWPVGHIRNAGLFNLARQTLVHTLWTIKIHRVKLKKDGLMYVFSLIVKRHS